MDNGPATSPKVVQLNPQKGGVLLPNKSFFSPKMFFVFGGLLVLLVSLGVGIFLVQQKRSQDLRGKAANLGSGWPVSPSPADGATGVDLSPIFRWDYETPNNTNCNPSGSYANVYLWDCAAHNDSCLIGFGGRSSDTQSIYEVSSSEVHPYYAPGKPDYSKSVAPLAPGKQYWWSVTPRACGLLHFEENKAWTFTTGSTPPTTHKECRNNACVDVSGTGTDNCPNDCQAVAVKCDSVAVTPANMAITRPGETRTLTAAASGGRAPVTFSWVATGGTLLSSAGPTVTWTAPSTLTTTQSWIVTATARDADGVADSSGCTRTFTYTYTPPPATAACQLVSADKDLASIKIDDTVTFTGYGVTSAESEIIDKINFIISRGGIEVGNTEVAAVRDTTKDSAFSGKAWKATQSYKVSGAGDYSVRIRVHWKDHDWKE